MTEYPVSPSTPSTFGIGRIISQSFSIFFRHFGPFFLLAFVVNLPSLLLQLGMMGGGNEVGIAALFSGLILVPVQFVLGLVLTGAILYGVYQSMRGQSIDIGRGVRIASGRLLPILGVSLVVAICVTFGTMLFIIPGIILALMFAVSVPPTVVEKMGPFDAMSRSRELTSGHRWELLGLGVVMMLIGMGAIMAFGAILAVVFTVQGTETSVLSTLISHTFSVAVSIVQSIAIGVTYYELRRDKEGLDLSDLASVFE